MTIKGQLLFTLFVCVCVPFTLKLQLFLPPLRVSSAPSSPSSRASNNPKITVMLPSSNRKGDFCWVCTCVCVHVFEVCVRERERQTYRRRERTKRQGEEHKQVYPKQVKRLLLGVQRLNRMALAWEAPCSGIDLFFSPKPENWFQDTSPGEEGMCLPRCFGVCDLHRWTLNLSRL